VRLTEVSLAANAAGSPVRRRPASTRLIRPEGLLRLPLEVRGLLPLLTRGSTPVSDLRQPLEPDIVARRLRRRIAPALRRSGGPSPPRGLREHSLNRQVASIAFEAKLPAPTQRSAGDTVQCLVHRLTFRKTHEHSAPNSQLERPPEDDYNPAPNDPKAAAHVQTRSARHDRTPEDIHGPEGPACATVPQTGVPKHTGARSATPIRLNG